MKKIILPISFVILLFAFGGIGSATTMSSSLGRDAIQRIIMGETPIKEAKINSAQSMNRFWNEEIDIDGVIIRLHKSVRNSIYFDRGKWYRSKEFWRIEMEMEGESKVACIFAIDDAPGFQRMLDALHPVLNEETDVDGLESPGMN